MDNRFVRYVTLCLMTLATSIAWSQESEEAKPKIPDVPVVIKTEKGDIEATIYASKVPMTAASFLNLARRGYYDGLTFHRVVDDFMIQGGDPTGTGGGGPGYQFADETRRDLKHDSAGILSMANSDDRLKEPYSNSGSTNGSQFFITHKPTPHLDGKHTVFGKVTEGQDVVNKIEQGDQIKTIEIHGDPEPLFEAQAEMIQACNEILDRKFGKPEDK